MATGLIGRKLGMTRVFQDDGTSVPVTVIEAGPCRVLQVQPHAVQLGYGARKATRAAKSELGHAKAAGLDVAPAVVREFAPVDGDVPAPGAEVKVDIFAPGELVKVTGTTKGRGFQGVVHRHGFGGGPATHGNTRHRKPGELVKITGTTKGRGFQGVVHRHGFGGGPASHGNTRHRKPGSIGPGTDPSRVIKGKKMPGHHGAKRHTELGLRVVKVDADRNLLFVRGAVPGSKNGIVTVKKQGGPSRHD